MAEEKLTLKIETMANAKALTSFNKELRNTDNYVKTLDKSLKNNGLSYDNLSRKSQALTQKLTAQQKAYDGLKGKLADYNKKLSDQKQKYNDAVKEGTSNEQQLAKLQAAYKRTEADIQSTTAQMKTLEVEMGNTRSEIERTNTSLSNFSQMQLANKFKEIGDNVSNMGTKITEAGQKISDFGGKVLSWVAPLDTALVTCSKSFMTFEEGVAKVNSIAQVGAAEISNYSDAILELSNNSGTNVNDLTEATYQAVSAGVKFSESTKFVEEANKLAVGGFTDSASAVDILTTAINAYGKGTEETEHLSSVLIKTQNLGKTTVNELAQSLGDVIPNAKNLGVSFEEVNTGMVFLTKQGIKTSEAATSLKSLFRELGDSGSDVGKILQEQTGKSFTELMKDGKGVRGVLEELNKYAEANGTSFNEMFGRAEALKGALGLLNISGEEYTNILNDMNSATGDVDKAFSTVTDTSAYKMQKAFNELKNSLVKVGEALTPFVSQFSEGLSKIADCISSLSEEQVQSIAKFALWTTGIGLASKAIGIFTTGIGGTVKTAGSLIKTIGNLITPSVTATTALQGIGAGTTVASSGLTGLGTVAGTTAGTVATLGTGISTFCSALLPVAGLVATAAAGIYAYHEYNEAMNDSILKTTDEMSWLEEGFRKLNGVQAYSKEELEGMNLVYEDFNENISPEFQKKVEEMRESISNFNMDLAIFSADGIFSDEEVEKLKNNFNEGVNQSIENIKARKEEVQKAWEETFMMDDNTIDNNEQTLLNFWNRNYDTSITEIEKLQADVNELFRKRTEEGYQFTSEDEAMIREYYEKVHQIELECMVNNQEEELFAKNKFRAQVATMDAESASKLGQERKKALENDLTETEAYYDTQIEMLETHYNEMTEEEKAAADIELEQLRSEKEQKVQAKRDEINAIYDEMIAGNENLKGVIDRFNLEVFEGESKVQNDRLNKTKSYYKGLEEITTDGMHKMYNEQTKSWEDVTVTVDEATGEITGMIRSYTDENGRHIEEVCGYNEDYKNSTQELADKMAQDYTRMAQQIKNESDAHVDSNGNIINSNGELIGSLEQVVDENGNVTTSVKDLNGNPIDINDNTGEVINGLENTAHKLNNLDGATANTYVHTWYVEHNKGLFSNTQKGYGYKNGQAGYWEQGTHGTLGSEQLGYINEKTRKSRGWELVDGPHAFLGSDSIGDRVLLGQGAAVTNNLTSTAMMMKAVQDEVASSINKLDFSSYSTPNSSKSRALQGTTIIKSPGTNLAGLEAKVDNVTTTLASLLNILINSVDNIDTDVYIDSRKVTSSLAPYMDIELQRRKNRR